MRTKYFTNCNSTSPSQVEGINGMYLANKLLDNHIKTFITYDKGQTWALLPAPTSDVAGNNLHCILVSAMLRTRP